MSVRMAMLLAVSALPALGFTSCQSRPNTPDQVTVVVEKFKPLPAWATEPLVKPEPTDDTVGARLRSNEARGGVIDVANCHRRLLQKLDRGEPIDKRECGS